MGENQKTRASAPLSILVVDDDALNQQMMLLLLKREGHSVECASDGQEAFQTVMNGSFDMVLMDLQMPVMDGVEASRKIRAWESGAQHTYIVALTASYLPERGSELFQAGIDNYIAKPFDVDHLRNILQYGIENRDAMNIKSAGGSKTDVKRQPRAFDPQLGIQRVGGNVEIYKELLREFFDELPDKLGVLWRCARNNDMDGLSRAAHNLKGVAGNLGVLRLSEYARGLEHGVGEVYPDTVASWLKEITTVSVALKEDIDAYLSGEA